MEANRNARAFGRISSLSLAIRKQPFSKRKPNFDSKGAAVSSSKPSTLRGAKQTGNLALAVPAKAGRHAQSKGPISSPSRSHWRSGRERQKTGDKEQTLAEEKTAVSRGTPGKPSRKCRPRLHTRDLGGPPGHSASSSGEWKSGSHRPLHGTMGSYSMRGK